MSKHFTLPYEGGLIEKDLPAGILHSYEKIWTHVYAESRPASYAIADFIVDAINAHKDGLFRLGLTTGTTPVSLYNELARRCAAGKVSFKNVEVVSIDEYYPSSTEEVRSRNHRIHETLLDKVDILKENIHLPDGTVPKEKLSEYCIRFDALARNLDLLVMGIGEQGQVGFNEAGSNEKTRTRVVRLSYGSRKRQTGNFNGDIAATPDKAITMGISTMLSAKRIILMAWGEDKAAAVKAIAEGPVTTDCPASLLQQHDHISFYVDETAASLLTRSVAPWLVGPCDWTPKFIRKAVVWLCEVTGKPILKLTEKDYLNNNLSELLEKAGPRLAGRQAQRRRQHASRQGHTLPQDGAHLLAPPGRRRHLHGRHLHPPGVPGPQRARSLRNLRQRSRPRRRCAPTHGLRLPAGFCR